MEEICYNSSNRLPKFPFIQVLYLTLFMESEIQRRVTRLRRMHLQNISKQSEQTLKEGKKTTVLKQRNKR